LSHFGGWQLVSVGYRLAPEHPYPAPVEDGLAVLGAIMMQPADYRADPDCIAVAGDSVGAGLAVRICRIVNERVAKRVKLQVLLCPAFDATPRFASRKTFARGYSIDADMIDADFNSFRGGLASVRSPLDEAGFAVLAPAIVHVAECDPFRDEGLAFAQNLRSARVPVEATTHAGMLHIFHAFSRFIPQGRLVLEQVGAQLKRFAAVRSLEANADESAASAGELLIQR
jgi:acetyl esterase/lipase